MKHSIGLLLLTASALAQAAMLTVTMTNTTDATVYGKIHFKDTPYGLLITPNLTQLNPGAHGFHVHTIPSCANNGHAAGGHYDPTETGQHAGPYQTTGHLGDLPVLFVDSTKTATTPLLAPRLQVADLIGHSIIIHANGDNYADTPKALGGGGPRLACGIAPHKKNDPEKSHSVIQKN